MFSLPFNIFSAKRKSSDIFPFIQIILSCANEEANPTVSREYHLLRRLIDIDENFIEVRELGEDLAMNVSIES